MKRLLIFLSVTLFTFVSAGCSTVVQKTTSIEEVATKENAALITKNTDELWSRMHPDDQQRWKDEQEYVSEFTRLNSATYDTVVTKEITDATAWTHPISGKTYTGVKEVLRTITTRQSDSTINPSYEESLYYQQIGDGWFFFSKLMSASDRSAIKINAEAGPTFQELSENTSALTGRHVAYSGQVLQIEKNADGTGYIRLSIKQDAGGGWNFDEVVFVTYTQPTDVLQDQVVTVYGILDGSYSYVSVDNTNFTLPALKAAVIER